MGKQPDNAGDRKRAEQAWLDFYRSRKHPRDEIDYTTEIENPWPDGWVHAGRAKTTYYASDKWQPKGTSERYYHDHDKGVNVWVAREAAKRYGIKPSSDAPRLGVKNPEAAAILGVSLGVDIEEPTGKSAKIVPATGSLLVCSPDRKVLYIVEPDAEEGRQVVAVITGPSVNVEPRGIVG